FFVEPIPALGICPAAECPKERIPQCTLRTLGPASAGLFLLEPVAAPREFSGFRDQSPVTQPRPLRWGLSLSRDRRDRGQNLVVGAQRGYRGQIMRGMTRKAKARVELAKLVVASARERAAVSVVSGRSAFTVLGSWAPELNEQRRSTPTLPRA